MTQAINLSPITAADLDDHWFTLLLKVWRDVRTAIDASGVEQKALADRIGMDAGQFNKIITGRKSNVTLRTLHNVARAAGYRLQISLEPLSSLRRPNSSFEAERLERVEKSKKIIGTTVTPNDGAWTRAGSDSNQLEAVP